MPHITPAAWSILGFVEERALYRMHLPPCLTNKARGLYFHYLLTLYGGRRPRYGHTLLAIFAIYETCLSDGQAWRLPEEYAYFFDLTSTQQRQLNKLIDQYSSARATNTDLQTIVIRFACQLGIPYPLISATIANVLEPYSSHFIGRCNPQALALATIAYGLFNLHPHLPAPRTAVQCHRQPPPLTWNDLCTVTTLSERHVRRIYTHLRLHIRCVTSTGAHKTTTSSPWATSTQPAIAVVNRVKQLRQEQL